MKRRFNVIPIFIVFGTLAVLLFFISKSGFGKGIIGGFEWILTPVQEVTYSFLTPKTPPTSLEEQNRELEKKLVDQKLLQDEVQALRDQFQTTAFESSTLLPSQVVGAPHFLPGVSVPSRFIINKGKKDRLQIGQGVVVKNNVVGKIVNVSERISVVELVTSKAFSTTSKTNRTGALGVVKGSGNGEMKMDSILLSEDIKEHDVIVTSGDMNEQGIGFPPNLIIGSVVSVDKKPSALFQTAQLKSPLDFTKITTVFVIL